MALAQTYDFDSGTLDATIATGGGLTVSGSPAYKAGIHGPLCARVGQSDTITMGIPATTFSGSIYLVVNSVIASSATRGPRVNNTLAGWISSIKFNNTGAVDVTTGTTNTASGGTWSPGDVFRIDWQVNHATTTLTWRFFKNANASGSTPDATASVNYSGVDSGAAPDSFALNAGGSPSGSSVDYDTIRLYDALEWAGAYVPPSSGPEIVRVPTVPSIPSIR